MAAFYNTLSFTEPQQKEWKKLCLAVKNAKDYTEYQKQIAAEKGPSYIQKRIEARLKNTERRLETIDRQMKQEIGELETLFEEKKRKIVQHFETLRKQLDEKATDDAKELDSTEPFAIKNALILQKMAEDKRDEYYNRIELNNRIHGSVAYPEPSGAAQEFGKKMFAEDEAKRLALKKDNERQARQIEREQKEREEKKRLVDLEAFRIEQEAKRKQDEERQRERRRLELEGKATDDDRFQTVKESVSEDEPWSDEEELLAEAEVLKAKRIAKELERRVKVKKPRKTLVSRTIPRG